MKDNTIKYPADISNPGYRPEMELIKQASEVSVYYGTMAFELERLRNKNEALETEVRFLKEKIKQAGVKLP